MAPAAGFWGKLEQPPLPTPPCLQGKGGKRNPYKQEHVLCSFVENKLYGARSGIPSTPQPPVQARPAFGEDCWPGTNPCALPAGDGIFPALTVTCHHFYTISITPAGTSSQAVLFQSYPTPKTHTRMGQPPFLPATRCCWGPFLGIPDGICPSCLAVLASPPAAMALCAQPLIPVLPRKPCRGYSLTC